MTRKKTMLQARPRLNSSERAFRDAMRDILAAEGWFELDVEPASSLPAADRAAWRWPLDERATA